MGSFARAAQEGEAWARFWSSWTCRLERRERRTGLWFRMRSMGGSRGSAGGCDGGVVVVFVVGGALEGAEREVDAVSDERDVINGNVDIMGSLGGQCNDADVEFCGDADGTDLGKRRRGVRTVFKSNKSEKGWNTQAVMWIRHKVVTLYWCKRR